ncbi:isochorismatase family protein [Variovorax sp. J31P207]|uniref:isochorismatase family protein n=1 Tax=Variovorax sp. J31P207 TaxID=3053510 RepID=UPI002575E5BD|nr:isochorismatase family protein [Variovorax sp. J31P207]MDM0070628.1 isochorismatase family protein [Variovorax sp. J31P207]
MNIWDDVISEDEQKAYAAAGFGRPSGLGQRPALLIIDVQYRTVGTERKPFYEAIKEFPTSCGEVAWDAVSALVPLIQVFRDRGWPVMYPHVAPKQAYDGGRLAEKVPAIMGVSAKGYEFVAEIAPQPGDVLIPKKHPSAFFGTAMCSHLIDKQIDTVIVVGCSTSGCVRGTAVDAFSLNFKVAIPQECVYDRSITSHKVNLFDLGQKYADVLPTADLIARLQAIA